MKEQGVPKRERGSCTGHLDSHVQCSTAWDGVVKTSQHPAHACGLDLRHERAMERSWAPPLGGGSPVTHQSLQQPPGTEVARGQPTGCSLFQPQYPFLLRRQCPHGAKARAAVTKAVHHQVTSSLGQLCCELTGSGLCSPSDQTTIVGAGRQACAHGMRV